MYNVQSAFAAGNGSAACRLWQDGKGMESGKFCMKNKYAAPMRGRWRYCKLSGIAGEKGGRRKCAGINGKQRQAMKWYA